MRALLIALLTTGCVIGEEAGPGGDGDGDPNGTAIRPVPTNGLVLDIELAARLPPTALAANAAPLLGASGGRQLLKYATLCALPAADTLSVGGEAFAGFYGLAPQWATGACDATCQRWVSACLLAHANANGTSYPISLRGEHPALRVSPETAGAFPYQEAAFYGNVFQRQLHACYGEGALPGELGPSAGDRFLAGRICGELYGDCGLVANGPCEWGDLGVSACKQRAPAGGGYADCHTGGFTDDIPRVSPTIHEVITVYLRP